MIWIILYALSCLIAWPLLIRFMADDWKRTQLFSVPLDRETVVFCVFIGGIMSLMWPLLVVSAVWFFMFQWALGKAMPILRRTIFRGIDIQD